MGKKENKPRRTSSSVSAARTVALWGILLALALVFSFLDGLARLPIPLPGVKLGLCNIVVIIIFTLFSKRGAAAVSLARVIIITMLFGGLSSFLFSLLGAALSYLTVFALWTLFKKETIGYIGLCAASAAAHNIGQIAAACILTGSTAMLRYLPMLLIVGALLGVLTGSVCIAVDRTAKYFIKVSKI